MQKILIIIVVIFFFIPGTLFAHQPRIPERNQISVIDPEISKAYYSQLKWSPHSYSIHSDVAFVLYVNILVPDISGQKQDISVNIVKDWNIERSFAILDGTIFVWTKLEEPFGYDTYWKGPEYRASVEAGQYDIIVSSTSNDSKYSLAIGETELFDLTEIMNALYLVPKIKRDFFNESPITFIFSPFGAWLIWVMFAFAFIFGFSYRLILRKSVDSQISRIWSHRTQRDRFFLLLIWSLLLIWAITTSWSPILLFFSWFAFFEAMFHE